MLEKTIYSNSLNFQISIFHADKKKVTVTFAQAQQHCQL